MINFKVHGNYNKTERFLHKAKDVTPRSLLDHYGQMGVNALEKATPMDTGVTANSWSYEINTTPSSFGIVWTNSNTIYGKPLVIMLQYGHGTGTGGYVRGRDFINPAIQPIFDQIQDAVWKEVTSL